jgi:response regulator RpfG family c-di-GMP phosphodiesterase
LAAAEVAQELMETHCDRGAEIVRKMRFSKGVVAATRSWDEHWDSTGRPCGLRGDDMWPNYNSFRDSHSRSAEA